MLLLITLLLGNTTVLTYLTVIIGIYYVNYLLFKEYYYL